MVGEFGEVQVMDWGIAKVLGNDESNFAANSTNETPWGQNTEPTSKLPRIGKSDERVD